MTHPDLFKRLSALNTQKMVVPSGKFIFRTGENPGWIYLIEKGTIKLQQENDSEVKDWLIPLSEKKIWGIKEAVLDGAFRFSALAVSDTYCTVVKRDSFLAAIKDNPGLKMEMMLAMANELASFPALSFE